MKDPRKAAVRPLHCMDVLRRFQDPLDKPHQHGIKQQSEKNSAGSRDPFKIGELALTHGSPVKDKSQKAPDCQHQKRGGAHGLQTADPGSEMDQGKDPGQCRAQKPRHPYVAVSFPCRDPGGSSRSIGKSDRCAEGRELHEPVQRISAQKSEEARNCHDKDDTEGGLIEFTGQDPVLRHRGQHADCGPVGSDDSCQDRCQRGDRDDHDAGRSQHRPRGKEGRHAGNAGEPVQIRQINLPGIVSGRPERGADKGHRRIGKSCTENGDGHDRAGSVYGEIKVRSLQRSDLEPDKSPGREQYDHHDRSGRSHAPASI